MKKIIAMALLAFSFSFASADDVIKIIVPFAPGGPIDTIARLVAKDMKTHAGRTVVVENKTGANGEIAINAVSSTPPSETVLLGLGTIFNFAYNPALLDKSSLRPVMEIVTYPMMMVVPANSTLKTFADWRTKNPKKSYTFATAGKGSASYVAGSMIMMHLGKEYVDVPYGGHSKLIIDVLAGQVDFAILHAYQASQYIASGQLIPIAALTDYRIPEYPNTPTLKEFGITDTNWTSRMMLLSNATNNADDIKLLQTTMTKVLNDPKLNGPYLENGGQITPGNKALSTDWLHKEVNRTVAILRQYKLIKE